jgi:hypothetical protein
MRQVADAGRKLAIEGFFPEIPYNRKHTGDVNGDGFADLVVFLADHYPWGSDYRHGDAMVALADGEGLFEAPQKWDGYFCGWSDQHCAVGDFDGDGKDDVVSLLPTGRIWVALSTGSPEFAPRQIWWDDDASTAAMGGIDVADMDHDGRDDVVIFRKGDSSWYQDGYWVDTGANGDALVLRSNGSGFQLPCGYTEDEEDFYYACELGQRPLDTTVKVETTAEYHSNRPGGDYLGFALSTPNVDQCRSACRDDARCQAWTYSPPGLAGPSAVCWLKDSVPAAVDHPVAASGMKVSRPLAALWGKGLCFEGDTCLAGELDGRTEMGEIVAVQGSDGSGPPRVNVCDFWDVGSGYTPSWVRVCDSASAEWPAWEFSQFDLADMDGDGRDDLVGIKSSGAVEYGVDYRVEGGGAVFTRDFETPFECKSVFGCQVDDVNGDAFPDMIEITAFPGGGTVGEVHTTVDPTPWVNDFMQLLRDGMAHMIARPEEQTIRVGETTTVELNLFLEENVKAFHFEGRYDLVGLDAVIVTPEVTHYTHPVHADGERPTCG